MTYKLTHYAIGLRLKQIRNSLSLNHKKMGDLLGLHSSGYSKNELGRTFPSLKSLKTLFERLDISMDWFLFDSGPVYRKQKAAQAEASAKSATSTELQAKELKSNPEIHEMVTAMLKDTMTKYQLLADFQRVKRKD